MANSNNEELNKAVVIMEQYKTDKLNRIKFPHEIDRPDNMGEFLGYLDNLNIEYTNSRLKQSVIGKLGSNELNNIFDQLEQKNSEDAIVRNKSRLFISHSDKQSKFAILLKDFIDEISRFGDITVFCSSSNLSLSAGVEYNDIIRDNLTASTVVISLISQDYIDSQYCMMECGYIYLDNAVDRSVLHYRFDDPRLDILNVVIGKSKHIETITDNNMHTILYNIIDTLKNNESSVQYVPDSKISSIVSRYLKLFNEVIEIYKRNMVIE